ncbi:hypothetical protein ACU611_08635 [Klebsiella aerogenes]
MPLMGTASETGIVTISIGYVTESYSKNTTLDSLVSRADRALYVAKTQAETPRLISAILRKNNLLLHTAKRLA